MLCWDVASSLNFLRDEAACRWRHVSDVTSRVAGDLLQEALGPEQLIGPVLAGLLHTKAFATVLRRQDGSGEEVAQGVLEVSTMQVDLQVGGEGEHDKTGGGVWR